MINNDYRLCLMLAYVKAKSDGLDQYAAALATEILKIYGGPSQLIPSHEHRTKNAN